MIWWFFALLCGERLCILLSFQAIFFWFFWIVPFFPLGEAQKKKARRDAFVFALLLSVCLSFCALFFDKAKVIPGGVND